MLHFLKQHILQSDGFLDFQSAIEKPLSFFKRGLDIILIIRFIMNVIIMRQRDFLIDTDAELLINSKKV